MMSAIDMSLDEIIAKQNKKKNAIFREHRGRGGRKMRLGARAGVIVAAAARKSFGAGGGGGARMKKPSSGIDGVWQHDRFPGTIDRMVRVNLSNLAPDVSTADLIELFQAYNLVSAAVHHDEDGYSLGTADLQVMRSQAVKMLRDFRSVMLDGRKLQLTLLDEKEGAPIAARLRFSGGVSRGGPRGGVGRKSHLHGVAPSGGVHKKEWSSPYHRNFDTEGNGGAGRRSGEGGKAGSGRRGVNKARKTEAELDKELEAYMKK